MKPLFFLFFLFVANLANAQSKMGSSENVEALHESNERGLFPVQNFTHEDYGGHPQNWFITHDRNGFIYSANGDGILEYDGVSWRLITSPGLHAVRTVVADQKNVKWVGANGDLGYLEPDSLGFLQFKSLKDKIPPTHPLTGNVWMIFPDRDRILFASENNIYSWTGNQFHVIPLPGRLHRRYQVNGDVYFGIHEKGIYRLKGKNLQLIPGGKQFEHIGIYAAVPYKKNSVLFASRDAGFFVYNGANIIKFQTEIDDYLKENNLYTGVILSDSSYAFATLRAGVIIMDKFGRCVREITTKDGILNNQVYGIAQDGRNALWLALQTGISQVEPYLPYTFYDKRSGLEGTVSAMLRHKDTLYVGTYDGLFVQERSSGVHTTKFHRVEGIQNGCFSLLSLGKDLIGVSADGIFLISNGKVVEIKKLPACRTLLQSKKDPRRIFVGHRGGLSSIYYTNGQWQHEKDFGQVDGEVSSIIENDQGALWLGTTLHKVIKFEFLGWDNGHKQLNLDDIKISYYDDQQGLPKETNSLYLIDGELLVYTYGENGSLFKFDPRSGKFSKKTQFGKKFGLDSLSVYPAAYQNDGDFILLASMPLGGKSYRFSAARDAKSSSYTVKRVYDDRFKGTTGNQVYWDHDDLLWFGGERVTRYDLNISMDAKPLFRTYVRKVTLGQDSAIYGGEAWTLFFKPILKFSNNGLRFEFAAPGFMGNGTNKYQYQLAGFDNNWSEWTKETKKDYTNLPEGDYQFLVRAQNINGELSTAGVFNFAILAPWYRTWWAYVLYAALFIGFLLVVLQLRAHKLESEKKALELLVAERTKEIISQTSQLKEQAEKLQELDQVKSRFFANISHEFRTPLTLISGCLEDLISNNKGNEDKVRISIMQKNTTRLRQLIEQLLDLSKLESGKLNLNVASMNPANFFRAITSSFSSWAAQKQITLTVDLPEQHVIAFMDEDVIEKIINNLLSNAIKFTPQQGNVSLSAQWNEDELTVYVKDSGPGIPSSKINKIFERFYQVDDSNTRTQEGSGIGLALVKELVSLHHGQIAVESQPGKGTAFKVTIPIHRKYYTPSEIVSAPPEKVSGLAEFNSHSPVENYSEFVDASPEGSVILVVEDNIDLGRYIENHLPDSGIILASNGIDGLAKAIHHIPDLIISDVMMPEMDGVELCKRIKEEEKTSHIPVILLTAKADIESRLEGLETGADDYITKPFNARELQTRVKNIILQREKLKTRFSRTVILKPSEIAITSPDEAFLEKVMAVVERNLSHSEFVVEDFQKEIGMSRMQLHRKLKALTGHSVGEFMRIQRLIRASELLSKTEDNISEVCYQTGFTSLSYFAKCFKKQFGTTPKDYASTHAQSR